MKKLLLIGIIIIVSSKHVSARMIFSCELINTCKIKPTATMLLIFNKDGSSQIIFASERVVNCSHEWDRIIFNVECERTTIENSAAWNLDGIFIPPLLLLGKVNYFIEDEPTVCNPQYFWGIPAMPSFID
jgi:hypothetical protein